MADPIERRVTLADVAELSGMSKAAVSMILNDKPGTRLSAEAAEKVRDAAARLGYRPNPAARSLRVGRTRSIGFISDEVTITRYASGMIRGVLDSAREHEHSVLIAETGRREDALAEDVEMMLDRRVDGLLIGLMAARQIDVPKVPHGIPLVIVNGISPRDHPSVLPDESAAGGAVARHLVEAGHRCIGIVGDLRGVDDPRRSATIRLRFAGIERALAAAGITPKRTEEVEDWAPLIGFETTHRILDAHPDLTALVAGNDNMAFGVYQALAQRGLRVPDDISVISFDDEELASYQRPGLTTARLPYEEMAKRGVEMLIGDRELAHELVPMPLIVRDSVRRLG